MFYDLYIELCERKNVTPTRAAVEMGISKATPTTWKKRGLTPQGETLNKIANYFDVSTDYLLGIEKAPIQEDGRKPKLASIARLEEGDITPEMDKNIAAYIDFILRREKGEK